MIEKAPILITGCPRSGSGLVAGVVKICGAFGGNVSSKHLFQNRDIQNLEREYFKLLGVDPRGQGVLPNPDQISIPVNWKAQVEKIIVRQGYTDGPWMYKSSTMGLIWQIWNYAFPNAKWIIVRRKPTDIVNSCLKTDYMDAYEYPEEWLDWIREYDKRFVSMIEAGVNVKVIWPERLVNGDYIQLYETIEWLGLKWNNSALQLIDPLLWYNRKKQGA